MSDGSEFKKRLKIIGHLISGFVIIVKGYSKFEDHHETIGIILILLGLLFASFAVFHEKFTWIKKHEPWLLWLEGFSLALVSYAYFSAGKFALPICYLLCSLAYFVVGGYFYKYREAH